jgi:hypothetical protein
MAFLNDRTVGVGDTVDEARVVAIDRETVTLEYRGRRIVLTVSKG